MKKHAFLLILVMLLSSACSSVAVDGQLMDAIKAAAKNCKVDLRYAFVKDCKEVEALSKLVKNMGPTKALGTVSVALNSDDPKTQAVACKLLYREIKDYAHRMQKNAKQLKPAVVRNLIKGVTALKKYVVMYAVTSTVHAAMIKGLEQELYTMLDKHPQRSVRIEGYRQLMRFGRLKGFEKVKQVVASAKDKYVKLSALNAPLNMYKYSKAEAKAVGDWATPLLKDPDQEVAQVAGRILYRCGGSYIDAVLDEAEARAKQGKLSKPFANAILFGYNRGETAAQKERKEKLKQQVVEKK